MKASPGISMGGLPIILALLCFEELQALPIEGTPHRDKGKASIEPIEIGPTNKRELRELSILLGTPIGNARTAKAVIGVPSKTTYTPKCPDSLDKVDRGKRNDFIKLCPNLRYKEYYKHANRVASILNDNQETEKRKFSEQKRALIAAVNDMAKVAGAVPSLVK